MGGFSVIVSTRDIFFMLQLHQFAGNNPMDTHDDDSVIVFLPSFRCFDFLTVYRPRVGFSFHFLIFASFEKSLKCQDRLAGEFL